MQEGSGGAAAVADVVAEEAPPPLWTPPPGAKVCEWPGCKRDGKPFGSFAELARHMRSHTGEKPFACDFEGCNRSFSDAGDLRKHKQLVHSNERPFACDFEGCDKVFALAGKLTAHKKRHSDKKPFVCDFEGCGKAFVVQGGLTNHKKCHVGEKPFVCDFEGCNRPFSDSADLEKHKRCHTGEKPYACDFEDCGSTFAQLSTLNTHKRIHTGEKRFVCDSEGCAKAFAVQSALTVHKRQHTGERPFRCDAESCDAAFVNSGHLSKHKESMHSTAGVQRKKKQEEAMKNALVLAGYVESFERGRVPAPGEFIREVYFDHRCALARDFKPGEKKYAYVDFVVTTRDGRVVFLEVDEEQHGHNPQLCETTRMWNICESIVLADLGDDINVFWLRVNPNVGFHVGGKTLRTPREQRLSEVLKFLDGLKSSPSDPMMQIGYAFYDCEPNGSPLVLKDPDFHPNVKAAVVCISKGSQMLIQPCAFQPVNPLFAFTGAADLTAAAFEDAPESDGEFEEEDVPEGEAGGSSGKRPRVA